MHARVRADRARFQVSVGYRSGQIFLDLEGSTVRDGAFRCNWVAFRCSSFFFFFSPGNTRRNLYGIMVATGKRGENETTRKYESMFCHVSA